MNPNLKSLSIPDTLLEPLSQAHFTLEGMSVLNPVNVVKAELFCGPQQNLSIIYQLHKGFDVDALFNRNRHHEFVTEKAEHTFFDFDGTTERMRFTLRELSLLSSKVFTDATTSGALVVELIYAVQRVQVTSPIV